MEMNKWLTKELLYKWHTSGPKDFENLHVIGTCGECEHYKMFGSPSQIDICGLLRIESKPDFGCIHWEKKDV